MVDQTTVPNDLLKIGDVQFMFDRRVMQIYRWRKKKNFPTYHIPLPGKSKMPPVRFSLSKVLDWAKKNNVEVKRIPKILEDGTVTWPDTTEQQVKAFQCGIDVSN